MFNSRFNKLFNQIIAEAVEQSAFEKRFNFRFSGKLKNIFDRETAAQILKEAVQIDIETLENSLNTQTPIACTFFNGDVYPFIIITNLEGEQITWKFDPAHVEENLAATDSKPDYTYSMSSDKKDPKSTQEYTNNALQIVAKTAFDFIQSKIQENKIQKRETENNLRIKEQEERQAKLQAAKELIAQYQTEITNINKELATQFKCDFLWRIIHRPDSALSCFTPEVVNYLSSFEPNILKAYFNYIWIQANETIGDVYARAQYADGPNYYSEREEAATSNRVLKAVIEKARKTFNL